MTATKRVAVVIGSTRPTRICADIAAWTSQILQEGSDLHFELLDLAEINLPFLDEPRKAALGQYEHEHTLTWSRTIESFDGFVFVFPQYNWGYPAVLKNALDFLYHEWRDKPASLLTYGTRGGNKAADQFVGVLNGLHMRVLEDRVEAVITDNDVDDNWQLIDVNATLHPTRNQLARITDQLADALCTDALDDTG